MSGQILDERLIRSIVARVIADIGQVQPRSIPVELSARHVHLSAEHVLQLFGHDLSFDRELSQPGQFLCKERVRLIGPKGILDKVAILGPAREETQVEISLTDAKTIGIVAPIRHSGNLAETPGIVLAAPAGIVATDRGVIVAGRHIHMPTAYARAHGLKDRQLVRVRMACERPLVLEDVMIRVSDNFRLSMHIDFDEGNACGWLAGRNAEIIDDAVAETKNQVKRGSMSWISKV
jgi:propanediol utilization protein